MLDLTIDRLQLNIDNAAGHEHRVHPIALRAASLFAERLAGRADAAGASHADRAADALSAPPVSVDLGRMSDEQAADAIASAWLEALALKLGM